MGVLTLGFCIPAMCIRKHVYSSIWLMSTIVLPPWRAIKLLYLPLYSLSCALL